MSTAKTVSTSSVWTTNKHDRCVTECGWLKKKPEVLIAPEAYAKIRLLMEEFPKQEWLAFLLGEKDEDVFLVHDIYVPRQEVSSADCEALEEQPEGTIGVIHSHHSMGAFWSQTDWNGVNINNELSIVVSLKDDKMEWLANVQVEIPCGSLLMVDAQIYLDRVPVEEDFIETAKAKMEQKVVRTTYGYGYGHNYNYPKPQVLKGGMSKQEDTETTKKDKTKSWNKDEWEESGWVECPTCLGRSDDCPWCYGDGVLRQCYYCLGEGELTNGRICDVCSGDGVLLQGHYYRY